MPSDFFRILRGLEIDETTRLLQGAGAPGASADTNSSQVGSIYTDNTNGNLYTKILPGPGLATWSLISGGGSSLQLYKENPIAPIVPAAVGANSIALGNGATANATDSLAIGLQSLARIQGGVVQASGRFGSTGDAQVGKYLLRTTTINNAFTEMFVDGTSGSVRLVMPDDSTWTFRMLITGHRTDASDGHAGYEVRGVIYRASGVATTSIQGRISYTNIAESNTPWDVDVIADTTNGALTVFVRGQTGKTVRWLAMVETVEVTN